MYIYLYSFFFCINNYFKKVTILITPKITRRLGLIQTARVDTVIATILAIASVPIIYLGNWYGFLIEILFLHCTITYYRKYKLYLKFLKIYI